MIAFPRDRGLLALHGALQPISILKPVGTHKVTGGELDGYSMLASLTDYMLAQRAAM